MTEHLTISSEPPEEPGMNFALLRQEGLNHIERLAGKLWTDYNSHDPGITILEQLCYAITDLSYRLNFEMQDLLAPPPGEKRQQFFTAREILTVNPLTINDYRKLLIDIDEVKNAWLEPIKNSQPSIYYDSIRHTLTFAASEVTQPVNLNGLYRVLIEKEKNRSDEASLIEEVKSKLNQHRNLCEDFASVEILGIEQITVQAEIEIEEGFDVNELMAKMYFGLDNFISPNLQFFTLKELLEKGKTPEAIFDGVTLEHGFIDDEQLNTFIKKDQLHTSDLIRIILDIEGIKTVRSIAISNDDFSSEPEEWTLALAPNLTPQLKDLASSTNKITFYKEQISFNANPDKAQRNLQSLQKENTKSPSTTQTKDIPIPMGEYRELSDYESIQNDFPANYGIGEIGLPASASLQRKAQAKQLQAYLMFFDRLLADYFAQLEHAKDLFSFRTKKKTTYFSQDLSSIPGATEILNLDNNSPVDEWNDIDKIRKNRFLDRLIAQFSEKFTDYSLLLYDSILEEKLINNKVTFLQNYPKISAERGKAFNYTDSGQDLNTDNVSGLKQRICSLLGIPYERKTLAPQNQSDETEGFHIVEHILLRPRSGEDYKGYPGFPNFLDFSRQISEFKSSTDSNKKVICRSEQHGLLENDQIQIFDTSNYNGTYYVSNVEQDTFDIEKEFVKTETGKWVKVYADPPLLDPYSFQISFVFPNWPPRFKNENENIKQLIYNIISAETPAHITPYFHWLNSDEMNNFEEAYTNWLKTIGDNNAETEDIKSTSNKLIELLSIGRVARYQLEDSWQGSEFIDEKGNANGNKWLFFPDPKSNHFIRENVPTDRNDPNQSNDPTQGFVHYGDWREEKLIEVVEENKIKIKVESDTYQGGRPRKSIRIFTEKKYNGGLFIIDLDHIPEGLSVWPAFWLFGPNWPNNGEIDIIEGVNSTSSQNNKNHSVLHTKKGCYQYKKDIPKIKQEDCSTPEGRATTGCGIEGPENSFGHGFNKKDDNKVSGGVYACEWLYDRTIKIWFWARSNSNKILANVLSDSPDPNTWEKPYVTFNPCPGYFKNMEMVINTTLCGDWAGEAFPSEEQNKHEACRKYVGNPENNSIFKKAYFLIRSIKVFQLER